MEERKRRGMREGRKRLWEEASRIGAEDVGRYKREEE